MDLGLKYKFITVSILKSTWSLVMILILKMFFRFMYFIVLCVLLACMYMQHCLVLMEVQRGHWAT